MKSDNRTNNGGGWPLSPATVRAVLSGHSILGLAFAAVIYLVCLTGTIAVFAHDLERWEQPAVPAVTTISDAAAARAIAAAAAQAPADTTLYVSLPTAAQAGMGIVAYSPTHERGWAADAKGNLVAAESPWAEFLLHLHINLHLPRSWGEFIVGLAGVALLSSLVSGVLAHPRIFKDAFHLRLGGSRRLQEADLHNRLGVWALPFHFVIALTGALLGLSTLIVGVLAMLLYRGDTAKVYGMFLDAPPKVDARAAPLPDLIPLLAQARAKAGGGEPQSLIVEHAGRADARVSIASGRPRQLVQQDQTSFDAKGRVVIDRHPQDLATGTRLLGGIGQLHFGWFGGLPVRLAYGLLGLALCVITSSGVTIWLARRRNKGRPAPMWERLWASVVWGQPAILALTALATTAAPGIGDRLPLVWLALSILLVAAAGFLRTSDPKRIARILRSIFVAGLIATVLLHVTLHLGAATLAVWLVDASLLVMAILVLKGLLPARSSA